MNPEARRRKSLSQVTVQPLWKQAVDGTLYAHAELRLRGAWLLEVFAPHTKVRVLREDRDGQTVLVISAADRAEPTKEEKP
jgi:hypothetical protein